jgi:hypothetical protein
VTQTAHPLSFFGKSKQKGQKLTKKAKKAKRCPHQSERRLKWNYEKKITHSDLPGPVGLVL